MFDRWRLRRLARQVVLAADIIRVEAAVVEYGNLVREVASRLETNGDYDTHFQAVCRERHVDPNVKTSLQLELARLRREVER